MSIITDAMEEALYQKSTPKLKKYNLIQKSAGVLMGHYIGSIFATHYIDLGNAVIFYHGTERIAAMNFVRVEECITDE